MAHKNLKRFEAKGGAKISHREIALTDLLKTILRRVRTRSDARISWVAFKGQQFRQRLDSARGLRGKLAATSFGV